MYISSRTILVDGAIAETVTSLDNGKFHAIAVLVHEPKKIRGLHEPHMNVQDILGYELVVGVDAVTEFDLRQIYQLLAMRGVQHKVQVHPKSIGTFLRLLKAYPLAADFPHLNFVLNNSEGTWRVAGLKSVLAFSEDTDLFTHTHTLSVEYAAGN